MRISGSTSSDRPGTDFIIAPTPGRPAPEGHAAADAVLSVGALLGVTAPAMVLWLRRFDRPGTWLILAAMERHRTARYCPVALSDMAERRSLKAVSTEISRLNLVATASFLCFVVAAILIVLIVGVDNALGIVGLAGLAVTVITGWIQFSRWREAIRSTSVHDACIPNSLAASGSAARVLARIHRGLSRRGQGAKSLNCHPDSWRSVALTAMSWSRCIVIDITESSPHIEWELAQALQCLPPQCIILCHCPSFGVATIEDTLRRLAMESGPDVLECQTLAYPFIGSRLNPLLGRRSRDFRRRMLACIETALRTSGDLPIGPHRLRRPRGPNPCGVVVP